MRFAIAALLFSTSVLAQEDMSWQLNLQTRGGTVSSVKNLSQSQCESSKAQILNAEDARQKTRIAEREMWQAAREACIKAPQSNLAIPHGNVACYGGSPHSINGIPAKPLSFNDIVAAECVPM